jgi:hypothetical protein
MHSMWVVFTGNIQQQEINAAQSHMLTALPLATPPGQRYLGDRVWLTRHGHPHTTKQAAVTCVRPGAVPAGIHMARRST